VNEDRASSCRLAENGHLFRIAAEGCNVALDPLKRGDLDGAVDDYTKALEADGTFASSYSNRGWVYFDRKEYDRAIAEFDHAIKIDGDKYYNPFEDRALAYWSKGDPDRAAADYKKALSLHPSDKAKQAIEKSLKDIEGGAKYPPSAAPANKQGSTDTPTDDKNSALSGVREGGSGNGLGLPSIAKPTEGQGSSLSLLPKEGGAGDGSGLPSGTKLPERQASPLPALPSGVATTARPGVYRLYGLNPRGDTYAGLAVLAQSGDNFRLTVWNGEKIFQGKGQFADGVLKMKYSDNVRVNFKLNSDGSLDGTWGKGDGSEKLEPAAFPAPTDMPLAEGIYSVAGKQPDGKPTAGTVKITKRGTGYHLEWTYDDGDKLDGWGTFARNILSLSAANNAGWAKDTAIAYALGTDGVLAGLYANGTGQEKLTPEGWRPSPSADATPQDNKPGPDSTSRASADPKKDAEYCMKTLGPDAMPACDRAIASGTFGMLDLGALHGRRAVLHFANRNDDAAIAEFSEAISLDGSTASYFGNRAVLYNHRNEYDKAIADLDEAIRLNPVEFSYYQNRAFAYLKKGITGQAQIDYNIALKLNPDAKNKKEIEQALKDLGPDFHNTKMQ
jgi:tetratricopeptide (TPR) repeat protein